MHSTSESPVIDSSAGLRRPRPMVFLHWATALLIALVIGIAFVRDGVEEKALRATLMNIHRSIGLTIALLAMARIVVRLAHRPLPPTADMSPLARLAAELAHLALYALLMALPLIGWALSCAHGKPVSLFGLVTLPVIVEEDEDLADDLAEYHENAAWLLIGLVGVHAAAALYHHFVRRDNVLRAMLPARQS